MENLADQAFSICHNGGSILNKGHLFTVCRDKMYHLLNVQDSGQIPQWILNNTGDADVNTQLKSDAVVMLKYFPELNGPLDAKLIAKSQSKRDAYVKGIVQNCHNINNWKNPIAHPIKVNHEAKINKVLLGNLV